MRTLEKQAVSEMYLKAMRMHERVELTASSGKPYAEVLRVPGGWVYRLIGYYGSTVFVPERDTTEATK